MRQIVSASMRAAIGLCVFGGAVGAAPTADRPNFVFILADDWGWGDLGCYGHQQLRTPNLDRLAREGIRFTQFYVASGVCSPSRAAFLTGQFPARHRIHGHLAAPRLNADRGMPDWLDPKVITVARLLREAGYATAHFGKWHLGAGPEAPPPAEYGFGECRGVLCNANAWDAGDAAFRPRSTELFIDETIRFIEANRDRPFYVQTWLLDTHARLQPTPEQLRAYPALLGALKIYYSAATAADGQIGRLLARLDELGLSRNTIVVFSSDNGPEDITIGNASEHGVGSPGPFRGRKRSLYEGGIRTPFILRWPAGAPAGRVDNDTVLAAVDWLPTICAIAGVPVPKGWDLDGQDMSAAWRGRSVDRDRPLYWDWRFGVAGHVINKSPRLAIRDGRWKLLMNPDRSRIELYDIPSDPSELDNRAEHEPEVVARLSAQLLRWHETLPAGPTDADAGSNRYPWPREAK